MEVGGTDVAWTQASRSATYGTAPLPELLALRREGGLSVNRVAQRLSVGEDGLPHLSAQDMRPLLGGPQFQIASFGPQRRAQAIAAHGRYSRQPERQILSSRRGRGI
jgi:hypothetical protein